VTLDLTTMVEPTGDGGLRYTGPLAPARAEVLRHRFVAEGTRVVTPGQRPVYEVLLCDVEPAHWDSDPAEFGISVDCSPEQAWRYALGAFFGGEN
jgi:hypothetical protein